MNKRKREKFVRLFGPVRKALIDMERGSNLSPSVKDYIGIDAYQLEISMFTRPNEVNIDLAHIKLEAFAAAFRSYSENYNAGNWLAMQRIMDACLHEANAVELVIDRWRVFNAEFLFSTETMSLYQELESRLPAYN